MFECHNTAPRTIGLLFRGKGRGWLFFKTSYILFGSAKGTNHRAAVRKENLLYIWIRYSWDEQRNNEPIGYIVCDIFTIIRSTPVLPFSRRTEATSPACEHKHAQLGRAKAEDRFFPLQKPTCVKKNKHLLIVVKQLKRT